MTRNILNRLRFGETQMRSENRYKKKKHKIKWQRRFLLFLVLLPFAAAGYARYVEPYLLITRTVKIDAVKEVPDCTIVFFSDTHFGKDYSAKNIGRIVERINRSKPDIVVFGGDFLDNYARDREELDLDYIKGELSKIKSAYGKFAVWGNHDYGGGAVRVYEDLMTDGGFQVLENENCMIEALNIRVFGYDDYLLGRTEPSLYQIQSQDFNLIVAHEPVVADFIENTGDNLLLTGHTHGGQVGIPVIRNQVIPKGSGRYVKGLYSMEELGTGTPMQLYVSSGIGTTLCPIRFMNVPEIVEIRLKTKR